MPRIDVSQPAELGTEDGRSISIDFLDLSRAGFKIRHEDELLSGDLVTIISARGSRARAEIKWVGDRIAGGVFVEPPEELGLDHVK
ncbi:hypothetical protein ACFQPG_12210 [Sphingomonas sp. GCM10030256]|uniref:hypothetical protein n=1 Tax=Sphingomonas sp. GCM10030256 TaxID=3273427 RepID=UPI003616799B